MLNLRRAWKWLKAKLVGRELSDIVWDHWYPPENSIQCWQAGPERCFYCLCHITSVEADMPCPRRRPESVELA